MSKLLLLVQTETDVQHLPGAAQAILSSPITGVWVVFSPAVTVNASEAAAKLDTEIEALKAAERAAADRGDYTAAAGYKTQREGKELDRAKALRDAWKSAPAEERQAKTKAIFAPFGDALKAKGLAVKITAHGDHYDREQWVAMLNSLSGVWFKEFAAGGFVVGWPEAVETSMQQPVGQYPPNPAMKVGAKDEFITIALMQKTEEGKTIFQWRDNTGSDQSPVFTDHDLALRFFSGAETVKVPTVPKTRREELSSMKYFTLVGAAKKAEVDPAGKKGPQIIEEILAAEAAKAAEPALAEY